MSLRASYTLLAPLYDAVVAAATARPRAHSLARLSLGGPPLDVLIGGAGTGLDLPLLPRAHRYVALDLTAGMLARARGRAGDLDLAFVQGDSLRLPFPDAGFDAVVLHLIVAVVPRPADCLREAARVLRPGGRVLIFDKFLKPNEAAPLRRALNPVVSRLATRLDVTFEPLLAAAPALEKVSDEPALAGGWFRRIELRKKP